jgi:hypothetical protein
MLGTGILPALLLVVMSVCLSTSADARRWKRGQPYSSYDRSARLSTNPTSVRPCRNAARDVSRSSLSSITSSL